ncbi:hypothetical protein T439DRAFT_320745 [Meredithblackwellia eburnea MCA 4105]
MPFRATQRLLDCQECLLSAPCCSNDEASTSTAHLQNQPHNFVIKPHDYDMNNIHNSSFSHHAPPAPSPSSAGGPASTSTSTALSFCCDEADCISDVGDSCDGGPTCPSATFVGWDVPIDDCEACSSSIGTWTGPGGGGGDFTDCCSAACFTLPDLALGAIPSRQDNNCPDCWGNTSTSAISRQDGSSGVVTPPDTDVTPSSAGPKNSNSSNLEDVALDDKAIQEILACCCCAPTNDPHPSIPSQHSHVHSHQQSQPYPVIPQSSHFTQHGATSTTPTPNHNTFSCKWAECGFQFDSAEALTEHVTAIHLGTGTTTGISLLESFHVIPPTDGSPNAVAKCLWDDCSGASLPASLPLGPYPQTAWPSSTDNGQITNPSQDATTILLKHLFDEHLTKLEPGLALALTSSLLSKAAHSQHPSSAIPPFHPHPTPIDNVTFPPTSTTISEHSTTTTSTSSSPFHSGTSTPGTATPLSSSLPESSKSQPQPDDDQHTHSHHPHPATHSYPHSHHHLRGVQRNGHHLIHHHRHHGHPYGVHPRVATTVVAPPLPSANGRHQCRWKGCLLSFETSSELMNHLSVEHVGSGKAGYVCLWEGCDRCEDGKGFAQRQKVMRHLQTHTGDRPFVCDVCNKSFSEATTLTQHMRVHTNERPYKCTHPGCEKAFSLASALTIHLRTHTGDKPFRCPFPGCSSAFAESSNLSKHIRTHKGERGHECDECGKAFSRSDQLARHKKIHAKARGEE